MPPAPILPANRGGNARGAAVGTSVGAPRTDVFGAVGDLLGTVAQVQQQNLKARDGIRSVEVEGEFQRNTQAKIAKLNPLDAGYEEQVRNITEDEKQRALQSSQMQTSVGQQDLEFRLTRQSQGFQTASVGERLQALNDEALRVREQEVDLTLSNIRNDPDNFDLYVAEFGSKTERLNQGIAPDQTRALAEVFGDRAVAARAEGLALDGRFDEANSFVDEQSDLLDQQTFRNLKSRVREIENRVIADNRANTASQVADLSIAITDAGSVSQLNAIRRDIELRNETGFFTGREQSRATLINSIEAKKKAIIKDDRDLNTALAQYESGTGIDDQKGADLVWGAIEGQLNPNISPEGLLDQASQFAATSGHLPTPFKRLIENAERTENPDLLASAARLHDDVHSKAPSVDTGLAPDMASRVLATSETSRILGIDYQTAAQQVMAGVPDAAALEERTKLFESEFRNFDPREVLDAEDIFDDPDDVPPQAAADFEDMLRTNFNLTGDRDIAIGAATRRFNEVYGPSGVGSQDGETRASKHPPERFFPGSTNTNLAPEDKTRILNAEIGRAMESLGLQAAIVAPERRLFGTITDALTGQEEAVVRDESGIPEFLLQADRETERDLAGGNRPSYKLMIRNSYGIHVPATALVEEDGRQRNITVRYTMPTMEELEAIPEYQELVQAGIANFQAAQPTEGSPFTSPTMNRIRNAFPFRIPRGE